MLSPVAESCGLASFGEIRLPSPARSDVFLPDKRGVPGRFYQPEARQPVVVVSR